MRLSALALAALLLLVPSARAQETLSADLAARGLAAVEADLAGRAAPTPDDRFALAGVRFLLGIEQSLRHLRRGGIGDPLGMVPVLRLSDRTDGALAHPETVRLLFTDLSAAMAGVRAALADLPPEAAVGLEIALADLWLDIDGNGLRDPGEGLLAATAAQLPGGDGGLPVIRFDTADAAWLEAYSHLLSGVAEIVLAYDPTAAIARVATARAALRDLGDPPRHGADYLPFLDAAAVLIAALDQQPDAARLLAARDHLLAMVAANRRFWAAVATETDDDREWIPNDRQSAALGFVLPPGTGVTWLAVLSDAERLLTGDLLVPHFQVEGGGAGVNLARMFTEPRPIGLADWIQGAGAVPYLERGPVADGATWRAFETLVGGDAAFFALILN